MIHKLLISLLFLIMTLSISAQDEKFILKGKPFIYVPFNKNKPHVDGKTSDEVWLKSVKFNLNKMDQMGPVPYYKTKVMAYSDKSNLYLSFKCFDTKMGKILNSTLEKDDQGVFKEDFIMVTLSTGKKEDKEGIFSIVVTANGNLLDSKGKDTGWNCKDFKFATNKNKNLWKVEMSIPFASILEKSKYNLKDGLLINIYRVRPEKSWDEIEESSWVPGDKIPGTATEKDDSKDIKNSKDFGYFFMQAFGNKPAGVSKNIIVSHYYNGLPALEVKEIDKKFIIDGDIEAQIKEGIKPIDFKMLSGDKKKPLHKTHVWILTTKLELIICIRNYESSINKLKAVKNIRDKINWGDDINEIFFNIGEGTGNDFYQIAIDAEGTLFDGFNGKHEWNGNDIKAAVKKSKNYWDAEIQIPFDNLDMKKVRKNWKKPWRLNISRVRPAHKENEVDEETAWSPTKLPKSGVPSKFGYLFMNVISAKLPKK